MYSCDKDCVVWDLITHSSITILFFKRPMSAYSLLLKIHLHLCTLELLITLKLRPTVCKYIVVDVITMQFLLTLRASSRSSWSKSTGNVARVGLHISSARWRKKKLSYLMCALTLCCHFVLLPAFCMVGLSINSVSASSCLCRARRWMQLRQCSRVSGRTLWWENTGFNRNKYSRMHLGEPVNCKCTK